ncbi:MAG TPA: MdtA/MuxA family multidrug efflux RND transporter periplasmic adaptor subunit [Candidatus Deferrimicrobiaceae bacterium]
MQRKKKSRKPSRETVPAPTSPGFHAAQTSGTSPASPSPLARKRLLTAAAAIAVVVAAGAIFLTCSDRGKAALPKSGAAPAARSAPVSVAAARKGDVGVYLNGLGAVVPVNTVTVRSRVDGQLLEVLFREGQVVSPGTLLARIDPRPFEAQLAQAEGALARDQALLQNARLDLDRYRLLLKQDSIARQQPETQEALVRQYEGVVKSDQGVVDNAKLQLSYSRIAAPIPGRLGLRLVDAGNIVHAGDPGGLVVITQLQPIKVIFSIPEDALPQLLPRMKGGRRLQVEAYDREGKKLLATGYLQMIDNQIDPATGTVKLQAIFGNQGNALFPNQFVNARLLLEVRKGTVVVPSAAILRNPQGAFVYVVKQDNTVTSRPVVPGPSQEDDTSVASGLAVGESVVVDGADRLRDGAKVDILGAGGGTAKERGAKKGRR